MKIQHVNGATCPACDTLPFWESMTKMHDNSTGITVRVWRREAEFPESIDREVIEHLRDIPESTDFAGIFEHISKLERIAAIEITDKNGMGAVKYLEW